MESAHFLDLLRPYFEGEVQGDDLHRMLYATDASVYRMMPLGVVFPKHDKDISAVINWAQHHNIALTPRTAGTSLAGQCVTHGVVVDVSRYMTNIIALDIERAQVTVQPGVIRDELNAYLASYGLFFGPNTSTSNRCMIGGMVGNNSSGTTSIKYGVTRDKVRQIDGFLSDGTKLCLSALTKEQLKAKEGIPNREGIIYQRIHDLLTPAAVQEGIRQGYPLPEIHRRNTGYAIDQLIDTTAFDPQASQDLNLASLMCGSEGTLFFSTAITLSLDHLPPRLSSMVVAQYEALSDCMNDVVVAMKHDLYTCELMDDVILDCTKNNKVYQDYGFFISGRPKAVLFMECRARDQSDLDQQVADLMKDLSAQSRAYALTTLTGTEIDQAMDLRKAGLGLLGSMIGDKKAVACIEDTAVALKDLPEFIEAFTQIMKRFNQQAVYYAHAGAGELHLRPILNLKKGQDVSDFREITQEVSQLVKRFRGSLSGEHGDGIVRSEFIEQQIGAANYALLREIKSIFDPKGLFNPGKIVAPWPMDESLRYSPDEATKEIETAFDFSAHQGIMRLSEQCNGSGDCRKTEQSSGMLCPSYHATRQEKDSTRGRANVLREVLTHQNDIAKAWGSEALNQAFDLCVGCKACHHECPSNVDMATVKSELAYQRIQINGATWSERFFGLNTLHYQRLNRVPGLLFGLINSRPMHWLLKKTMGIHPLRSLPHFSSRPFAVKEGLHPEAASQGKSKKIYLWVDEFTNYLEPGIAQDAYELLQGLGYFPQCITHLNSARSLISKGFLDQAKEQINQNLAYFTHHCSDGIVVGIEPSAILGLRDEYLKLALDQIQAEHWSKNSFLIEEFLVQQINKGKITAKQFTTEQRNLKIHVHCHQKALSQQKHTFDLMNLPSGYKPTLIASGCCGMAGSFGFEKEHYDVSMAMANLRLLPAVTKATQDTIIVANGTSCRHQIKDGASREALHPVSVLRHALLPPA